MAYTNSEELLLKTSKFLYDKASEFRLYIGNATAFTDVWNRIDRFWTNNIPLLMKLLPNLADAVPFMKDKLNALGVLFYHVFTISKGFINHSNLDTFFHNALPLVGAPLVFSATLFVFYRFLISVFTSAKNISWKSICAGLFSRV